MANFLILFILWLDFCISEIYKEKNTVHCPFDQVVIALQQRYKHLSHLPLTLCSSSFLSFIHQMSNRSHQNITGKIWIFFNRFFLKIFWIIETELSYSVISKIIFKGLDFPSWSFHCCLQPSLPDSRLYNSQYHSNIHFKN